MFAGIENRDPRALHGDGRLAVSAVIPAYNAADTIERAIDSVLCQTYAGPVEVVVVDDGSEDDTASVVQASYPDVHLVRQANRGLSGARNSGVRAAEHDLLTFLDADDELLPTKLDRQVTALRALPASGVLFTWRQYAIERHLNLGSRVSLLRRNLFDRIRWRPSRAISPIGPARLVKGAPIAGPSLMLRRDTYLLTGGYDENIRISEDYPFFLSLMARGAKLYVLNMPLYRVHIRPDSLHRAAEAGGSVARIEAFERFDPRTSEIGRALFTEEEFDDAFQVRLLVEAVAHIDQGLVDEARGLIERALDRGDFDSKRTLALRVGLRSPRWLRAVVAALRRLRLLQL